MIDLGREFTNIIEKIRKRQDVSQLYKIFPFNLATARVDEELPQGGFYLQMIDATDTVASIDIRLNERANDVITLKKGDILVAPFYRIFISHTAQAGKTASLAVSPNFDLWRVLRSGQTINSIDTIVNPVISKPYDLDRALNSQIFERYTSQAGANTNALQVFNPVGSGKTVVVLALFFNGNNVNAMTYRVAQYDVALTTDIGTFFNVNRNAAASAAHLRGQTGAGGFSSGDLAATILGVTGPGHAMERYDVLGEGEGLVVNNDNAGVVCNIGFRILEF